MITSKNSVFILGAGINSLGVVRSFAKTSISVYALDYYKNYGMLSRFCKGILCPNPDNETVFVDFLIQFSKKLTDKPVIFATSDLFLQTLVRHKEKLDDFYLIPANNWEVLEKLLKKEYMYGVAEGAGIPCPKTVISKGAYAVKKIICKLSFPILVKPTINENFSALLGEKAFVLENQDKLERFCQRLIQKGIQDTQLAFQEYIPGEMTSLHTITCFADQQSNILGYSIGHKIRQFPPQSGTIISGRVKHVEEIITLTRSFIKKTGFWGICNIEYKQHPENGLYYLMEINPRIGLWNYSTYKSGVNLPLMAYKYMTGQHVKPEYNHDANLVWMISPMDLYYALYGYKAKGYPTFHVNFSDYLKSIKGRRVDATFRWDDPLPFFKGFWMKYR